MARLTEQEKQDIVLPFQVIEQVDEPRSEKDKSLQMGLFDMDARGRQLNGWTNMLIFGDNLQVLKTLLQMKQEGKLKNADGTPGVRLVYIDPPFATRQEFRGSQDQKAYQDKIAGAHFLEFLRKRLVFLRELLSDDGSIYIHLDQKKEQLRY